VLTVLAFALVAAIADASPARSGEALPTWRGVWEWSMDHRTEAGLTEIAESCRRLGFNALMASPPRENVALAADLCHRRGVRLYLSTVFTGGDPSWQQVMLPVERDRAAQPPPGYQQGGEPLSAGEVLSTPLPCWGRPEVRGYFAGKVRELSELPADGLAFDFVGYQNYSRCYCPACEARLAAYRQQRPDLTEEAASAVCAEEALVDFIGEMATTARRARPTAKLTIHVYPYFRPRPYYGHRLPLDFVGQTVAWFFRPHWPLAKVKRITDEVVAAQHDDHPEAVAAPFIGFYRDPPECRRLATRVQAELDIVKASGAQAIQMAELGHITRQPDVAAVVARSLGGTTE
jgi:hypothetical protein